MVLWSYVKRSYKVGLLYQYFVQKMLSHFDSNIQESGRAFAGNRNGSFDQIIYLSLY